MRLFARSRRRSDDNRIQQATSRRAGKFATVLLTAALLLVPMLTAPTAALAAGGTLNMTMDAVNPTVLSGAGASFRVQWTCSGAGSCDGAEIRIPLPTAMPGSTAFPGGVPLTVSSQSQVSIDGADIPGSGTVVGTAPNQELVWTFPATVATGKSGTVTFTLVAPNNITPDGSTITPVATFTATGAAPIVAQGTTTVTADVSLQTLKTKSVPTDVPYVDQQITYNIYLGYDSQFPLSSGVNYARSMADVCASLGTQALQNIVVVDTLLPGAQFVSANNGGVYNAATNTITWNLGSSIDDTTHACQPFSGSTAWTGAALQVAVKYPSPTFTANPSPTAVTNNVSVSANAWGQPGTVLTDTSSTSHGLRVGSPGASVSKMPGYDWAIGNPAYRGTADSRMFTLSVRSNDAQPARWQVTDMMPCDFTSPINTSNTGCATPGVTDLNFSASGEFNEVHVNYTTNTGATGVCVLPAGTTTEDRYCVGTTGDRTPISLPAGQWITKFEIDTQIPAFGGGWIYVHGTPGANLPTDNVSVAYRNPNLNVDRSDVHPWYVTLENCTELNRVTYQDGRVWNPTPNPQYASDNGGICGYRQVMTTPYDLRPVKSMYDPAIPVANRPAVPAVETGDTLTVDLTIRRSSWEGPQSVRDTANITPTVTEYLPSNLTMVPGSLQIVPITTGEAGFVAALGAPNLETETVTINGEQREKVTVTFPNAATTGANSLAKTAYVRFQVQVNDGVPAGTYTNTYLLSGAEAGPGIGNTYLVCSTGTLVDANLQPTTDRAVAVGCLATAQYTVLPVPGVSTDKQVQGVYDQAPVSAPGIGTTSIDGPASYTIDVTNSGSVDITNVVSYDLLPRVGDTLTLPGTSQPRNSEFAVKLTGPVPAPAGATVQYSTALNPCRGELAGTGGGTTASAPAGCANDWSLVPAGGDFSAVTAIRIDFGTTVFSAGRSEQLTLSVTTVADGSSLDGVAWNNVAITAREAASGSPTLPTEQSPVGLQMLPDLSWKKVDGASGALLAGSEWTVAIADGRVDDRFPMTVVDCAGAPCAGADQDPVAGQFRLVGLPWGEYTLTETGVPPGYIGLTDPVDVALTPANVTAGGNTMDLGGLDNDKIVPGLHVKKTSDPASGSTVTPNQEITYSVVAENTGNTVLTGVTVTDDLSDVLDNATFVAGSESSTVGAAPVLSGTTLTWNGDLPVGGTVTLSYTVTVNADVVATDVLKNVVTGTSTEVPSNCVEGSTDPDCTTTHTPTPTPGLHVVKTSDPASGSTVTPNQEITYSVVASNTGNTVLTGVDITDDLSDVLDNATFVAGSESSTVGSAPVLSGTTLTWNGDLPVGGTVTLSYTVTVNADVVATDVLKNVVTGTSTETPSNCVPEGAVVAAAAEGPMARRVVRDIAVALAAADDPDCSTTHTPTPTPGLHIVKTSDPASGSTVTAGQDVTYSVVASNTGNTVLTGVTVTDDLSDVLDNATFVVGSENASLGSTPTLSGTTLTWTGDLPVGATVTIRYTVKVKADVVATDVLRNVVTGGTPETPSNCVEGTGDPECSTDHPVLGVPGLHVKKTSDPASGSTVTPSQEITYSVVASNTGNTVLTGVTVTDDLSDVLDNAAFVAGSESSTVGSAPVLSGTTLTWNGDLPVGGTVTLSYTVTVNADVVATDLLRNVVTGGTPETPSNCVEGSDDPDCSTTHPPTPTPGLHVLKTSDPASGSTVTPNQEITYSVVASNTGNTVLTGVTVTDDLSDVLDNATFVAGSESSTVGAAPVLSGTTLTWNGDLPVGGTVTLSYTVTVNADVVATDLLKNVVTGTSTETPSNCVQEMPEDAVVAAAAEGPMARRVVRDIAVALAAADDPDCSTTHTPTPTPGLHIVKTADPASGSTVTPGQEITYSVVASNTGNTVLTGVTVTDDLSDVLDNATFVAGSESSTVGAAPVLSGTTLTWNGDLPVGGTVTLSYTVTVNADVVATDVLRNVVTGGTPETPSNCVEGSDDPDCSTTHPPTPTPGLHIVKTSDPASGTEVKPGQEITYSVVAENTGNTVLTGVDITDDLSDVLDNATFVAGSESSTVGAAPVLSGTTLTWNGDLPVGGTVTLSYTVTVNADVVATDVLRNVVTGGTPETPSNCVEGSDDPDCSTTHPPTPTPGLHIVKTSDPASGTEVKPGQEITY
ncbi:isopeptide-forming domain-containing fimbrial protein, partial [Microbacterium sp. ZW T5_56]|uniref:DUF7927 domain-containing protein n=1 Tax=Microbacterium sp. ZW T5_56 TaxID=3378081 RepID=UPI003854BF71